MTTTIAQIEANDSTTQEPRTQPVAKKRLTPERKRIMALQRFAASITAFTILGHLFLGFEQSPLVPITAALFAYVLEIVLEIIDAKSRSRPLHFELTFKSIFNFLLPAHISAMAVAMLLFGGAELWPYLLAVAIAITSKYVLKAPIAGKWRHVLNPSNTGIALVLVMFPWVGIAPPYQFTANVGQPWDWLIPLGILGAGTMLNAKLTGKGPLILAWVLGFIAQAGVRAIFDDHLFLPAIAPLTGVAFILFTNYMITDPGTTPFGRRNQVIFGLGCAAWYGVLLVFHVSFGLFFALVATCLTRATISYVRYGWMRLRSPNNAT